MDDNNMGLPQGEYAYKKNGQSKKGRMKFLVAVLIIIVLALTATSIYLYTSKSDQKDIEIAYGYVTVYDASGDVFMEYEGEYILDAGKNALTYTNEDGEESTLYLSGYAIEVRKLEPETESETETFTYVEKEFSEGTKEILGNLDMDVTIFVYVNESEKDSIIHTTLMHYQSESEHITIKYIDPDTNPTFYEFYTDSIVSTNSLFVVSDLRSRVVDLSDIMEYTYDYTSYYKTGSMSYAIEYDAEGEITRAIEYVTMGSDEMPIVYEIIGHDEIELGDAFTEELEKAYITLKSLELLNEESVPEDASALIINSPSSDFNEADAQKVIDYLQAGGKVLIACDLYSQELTNFQSILEAYRISSVAGVIAENDTSYYYYQYGQLYLLPDVASTNYSSSSKNSDILVALCQGFAYGEDSVADGSETITYTEILTTSNSAVSKTDYENITTSEYEAGDTEGPFTIALAAEQTTSDGEGYTQLVLVGSEYFLNDSFDSAVSNGNSGLFMDIMSALIGDVIGDSIEGYSKTVISE